MNWPMCERSNMPAAPRTARCSSRMPLYWIGMRKPPNGAIFAPRRSWTSDNGVRATLCVVVTAPFSRSSASRPGPLGTWVVDRADEQQCFGAEVFDHAQERSVDDHVERRRL